MAVDRTLIRGAFQANAPQKLLGVEAMSKAVGSITDAGVAYMSKQKADKDKEEKDKEAETNKHSEDYEKLSEKVLQASELQGKEFSALYDQLQQGKEDYLNADEKGKAESRQDLKKMYDDYLAYKETKSTFADGKTISTAYTHTEEGKAIVEAMNSEANSLTIKDGRVGLQVGDEFKTVEELNRFIKNNSVDVGFRDVLSAVEEKQVKLRDKADEDSPFVFDDRGVKQAIMDDIHGEAKLNSLIHDELVPGRNFKKDLISYLDETDYQSLGIPTDIENDGLTEDEKKLIITKLMENKDLLKENLGDYYSNILKQRVTGETGVTQNNTNNQGDDDEIEDMDAMFSGEN